MDATAHQPKGTCHSQSIQYRPVVTDNVTVPSRYDALRPTVSATTPVGISKITIPTVKNALAANASKLVSPASSKKRVLMPQMSDAARVLPSISVRYTRWTRLARGFTAGFRSLCSGASHQPLSTRCAGYF